MEDGKTSRKLLHDMDAERAVLSACLLDAETARRTVATLAADDFLRQAHRRIFEAVAGIVESGGTPDVITVAHRLAAMGALDESRGRSYLLDLADDRISILAWADHVRIVREYSVQRRIAKAAVLIVEESCRPQIDFEAYLEYVRRTFAEAAGA